MVALRTVVGFRDGMLILNCGHRLVPSRRLDRSERKRCHYCSAERDRKEGAMRLKFKATANMIEELIGHEEGAWEDGGCPESVPESGELGFAYMVPLLRRRKSFIEVRDTRELDLLVRSLDNSIDKVEDWVDFEPGYRRHLAGLRRLHRDASECLKARVALGVK